MSITEESTVAERLAFVDKLKAEARLFASKIKHKNRTYRRTRLVASLMISEAIGADYSEEQLRKSDCSYIRVGRTPLYSDADLKALAEQLLDAAIKRGGAPQGAPLQRNSAPQRETESNPETAS